MIKVTLLDLNEKPQFFYLQILRDENLPSFLDHGLRLQLLGGKSAFTRVKHLLTWNAGQSQVSRVRLVAGGDLDGVWIDGTGSVPGAGDS